MGMEAMASTEGRLGSIDVDRVAGTLAAHPYLEADTVKAETKCVCKHRKIAQEYRDAAEGGVVLCVMCGRPARDLDEKLSRARGGSPTDRANIQPLCPICHHLKTVNPAWAEAEGWSLSSWGTP